MMKLKNIIFFIFVFIIFSILGKTSSSFYNRNANTFNKKIYVFSIVDFIDFKFNNVIPFIEPAAIDGFSYIPKYAKFFSDSASDIYGYNILKKTNHYSNECLDDKRNVFR